MAGARSCRQPLAVVGTNPTRPRASDLRGTFRQVYTASASIASPLHIEWQPASCPNVVYTARAFDTLRATTSSHNTRALGARALLALWVDSRTQFVAPATLLVLGQRTMVLRVVLTGPCWTSPILPIAANDANDEGISGGRQGLLRQRQVKTRPPPSQITPPMMLQLTMASWPMGRPFLGSTR